MKEAFAFSLFMLVFAGTLSGQTPCSNVNVISPVVTKPKDGGILSVGCTSMQVQWKGTAGQSYRAGASWYNATTNKWDSSYAATFSCDGSLSCKADIPVQGGTAVSWSVQAVQVISGRSFYSYYLIGDRGYAVPLCTSVTTKAKLMDNVAAEQALSTDGLLVYPNPATNEINIQWSGEYKGTADVTINDAAGKRVRLLRVTKDRPVYSRRIPLHNTMAGLYYVQVKPQNGQLLTKAFLKQ
jgi:hypothetical protein